jgi:glutamine synthetase
MKIIAEYIWLDGAGNLRSKARTLEKEDIRNISNNTNRGSILKWSSIEINIPYWNYDGSSTGQADGTDSEIKLNPCAAFPCPFRRHEHILVMCDTYKSNGEPALSNHRHWAKEIFDKDLEQQPWYGIEQEFFILDRNRRPLTCWDGLEGKKQGQYYCSVGSQNAFGRKLVDKHLEFCLYAGLNISGINAEVAPAQWEYQIGPVEGIDAGDQLYISRYILQRVAEEFDMYINFDPKPLKGNWNGSGCHTNYSTKAMREGTETEKTGLEYINEAIHKLSLKHNNHMKLYGTGNEQRMTGEYETSSFDKFSFGIANRGASVRIPRDTEINKCGYLEDRRPSSNMDPYLVTGILFDTTVLS